jgi:hypothetical protein
MPGRSVDFGRDREFKAAYQWSRFVHARFAGNR